MRMFFLGLFAAAALINSQVEAQAIYYNPEALRICRAQYVDSDKASCMQQIKGQQFDSQVIGICAAQYVDSDKRTCLRIIENKRFLSPEEISFCKTRYVDSQKRECLANASTSTFRSQNDDESFQKSLAFVEQQVSTAINALQRGNLERTENVLKDLKIRLRNMQKENREIR